LYKDGNDISAKVDEVNESDDIIRIAQFINMKITEKSIGLIESSFKIDGKIFK
jgi:hypothetical protein